MFIKPSIMALFAQNPDQTQSVQETAAQDIAEGVSDLLYGPAGESEISDNALYVTASKLGVGFLTGSATALLDESATRREAGDISGQEFEDNIKLVIAMLIMAAGLDRDQSANAIQPGFTQDSIQTGGRLK